MSVVRSFWLSPRFCFFFLLGSVTRFCFGFYRDFVIKSSLIHAMVNVIFLFCLSSCFSFKSLFAFFFFVTGESIIFIFFRACCYFFIKMAKCGSALQLNIYKYIDQFFCVLCSHQYCTSHTEYAEQILRWNTETQRNISYINWREIRWSREWMNMNNGRKVIQLWRWRRKKKLKN